MSRAIQSNTTCAVYRSTNAPPAAPDLAGVKGFLRPWFPEGYRYGAVLASDNVPTHILDVPLDTDIRDDGSFGYSTGSDLVYIPDQTGTQFTVIAVTRTAWGTDNDRRRVFLRRTVATWPTSYL